MNKKAIFLDIDGTYTYGSPYPCQRNIDAVRRAREAGNYVFINTGRANGFIPPEVLAATELDGVVAGGGAYITLGGEVLRNRTMSRDGLRIFTKHLLSTSVTCMFEGVKHNFYYCINDPDASWFPVENYDDFDTRYRDYEVTKVTLFGEIDDGFRRILDDAGMRVIQFPTYGEAVLKGCDKAAGIKVVLDRLGLKQEDSIAMGDSLNDTEMILYAGVGVAMGNAADEIKSIADYISCDARDGGVGQAIEELVLNNH